LPFAAHRGPSLPHHPFRSKGSKPNQLTSVEKESRGLTMKEAVELHED
jgi:hypothetical protein